MGFTLEQPTGGYQLEPEPEATWGEALDSLFSSKTPTTIAKTVSDMAQGAGEMIMHPVDTAVTAGKLAASLAPGLMPAVKGVAGLASPFLSDEHKTQVAEILKDIDEPKNAIGQMLKERYGSVANIKKTIRDDPGGFLMDVGTVFTGGEAALAKAGLLLPKAGMAAKAVGLGEKVLGAGKYVDPVNVAFKGADVLARKLGPKWFGTLSGVGDETMAGIRDLAGEEGPRAGVRQNEFADALKGDVTADQFVSRAEQGLKNMRADANYGYAVNKKDWVAAGGRLDMSVIDQAERDMRASLHTSGGSSLLSAEQRESFGKMQEIIDEFRQRGPGHWTVEEMDALKRNLNKIRVPLGDRELMRVRTGLSNSVKDNILANASGTKYHDSMRQFAEAMDALDEMKDAFALEKNSGQHTTMSKLQSVLRNNVATQYGARKQLFDMLEKEGRVDLKPWLMGMTANSATPRGINRGVIGGILSTGNVMPGLSTVATLGSSSPRIGAEIMYGLGKHGDTVRSMLPSFRSGVTGLERSVEGERNREDEPPAPALPPVRLPTPPRVAPPPPGIAPGPGVAPGAPPGLFGRKRGGRVGFALGGDVDLDSLPPPAAMRGANNYFMPASMPSLGQRAPSQAIIMPGIEAKLPAMDAKPTNEIGDLTKQATNIFKEREEAKEKATKEDAYKTLMERLRTGSAPSAEPDPENKYDPRTGKLLVPAAGTAPDGTPLSGDSYEAKVGSFESGGKDDARNPSGASGRYQFMPATAEGIRQAHPELNISDNWRTNPDDQKKLMTVYTDTSREILRKALGREPTGGELYALHLFGHGKGPSIVAAGNAPLASITSEGERAGNPFLKNFATAQELINYFNKRFG